MKEISLPIYGIKVSLDEQGGGIITSELYIDEKDNQDNAYNSAIDGIEAMILACACAGIDIEDERFIEAITTSVEAVSNNK